MKEEDKNENIEKLIDAISCEAHIPTEPLHCCTQFGIVTNEHEDISYCHGFRPKNPKYLLELEKRTDLSLDEAEILNARECTARSDCNHTKCSGYGLLKDEEKIWQCISYVPDFKKLKDKINETLKKYTSKGEDNV